MPELAIPVGYRLQPQVFQPINPASYFNRELPAAPVPRVDSAAKAGAFGAMMKMLGELPAHLTTEYEAGKKRGLGSQVQKQFQDSLAGKPGSRPLSDWSATGAGEVKLNPEDADVVAARKARAEGKTPKKSLSEQQIDDINGMPFTEPELPSKGTDLSDPFSELPPDPTPGKTEDLIPVSGNPQQGTGQLAAFIAPAAVMPTEDGTTMTQAAPAVAAVTPEGQVVPRDQREAIAGAAQVVGPQLANLTPESLTAATDPAGVPAPIAPVGKEQALAGRDLSQFDPDAPVKKALPVVGKTRNHLTGEVYLRDAAGNTKTYNPVTKVITLDQVNGKRYELPPGANAWREAQDKAAGHEIHEIPNPDGSVNITAFDKQTLQPIKVLGVKPSAKDGVVFDSVAKAEELYGKNTIKKMEATQDGKIRVTELTPPASDEEITAIAEDVAEGRIPPDLKGYYSKKAAIDAKLHGMGFNRTRALIDYNAIQRHFASLEGPTQLKLRQSIDAAYHHLDMLEQLGKEWDGGKYPILNRINLELAKSGAKGQDAAAKAAILDAQINEFNTELGSVFRGGNAPTNESLKLSGEALKSNFSAEVFQKSVEQARRNLQLRLNAISNIGPSGISEDSPYYKAPKAEEKATSEKPPTQTSPGALPQLKAAYDSGAYDGDPQRKALAEKTLRKYGAIK